MEGAAAAAVAVPPLVASIGSARRDRPIGGCFAAAADGLLASVGGAKPVCSLRWATGRAGRAGEEARALGGDAEEEEEAAEEEAKEAKARAREEAKEKKKKRLVTKGGGMKMKQGSTGRTG